MIQIEHFQVAHLAQLQELINAHLSALAPGWALPAEFIAGRLERNPGECIVDPWVVERLTLCAIERERLVAAAHLLRYGRSGEVGLAYRNASEIAWLLGWPDSGAAVLAVLAAARELFARWGVSHAWALDTGLWVGPFGGLADAWPHIATALAQAGYRQHADLAREEYLYGGMLSQVAAPAAPPLGSLELRLTVGRFGTRFAGLLEGTEIGYCECIPDLTAGGALPSLRGWAELAEIEVNQPWRGRGAGTWLAQQAAAWLRLGGCDRIVLCVAAENQAAGAGRFYQRLGWHPIARFQRGWYLHLSQEHSDD